MSQISPPVRILLVCAVAFMAAWMLFLKPGDAAVPAATPAPAAATVVTPTTATAPAPAAKDDDAAVLVAAAKAGMPAPVVRAVKAHKLLVLLFWNKQAADDRAVRDELRAIRPKHLRGVVTHTAPVTDVARYQPIIGELDVQQTPTVVVVDRKRQAEALVGYNDRLRFEQAIDDARRAGR